MNDPRLLCGLDIQSSLSLQEVGAILSTRIFGGIQFGGLEERIRDEVPAIYLLKDVLGFSVILQGTPSEGYFLEIAPTDFSQAGNLEIDFSGYVQYLLKDSPNLSIISAGYHF